MSDNPYEGYEPAGYCVFYPAPPHVCERLLSAQQREKRLERALLLMATDNVGDVMRPPEPNEAENMVQAYLELADKALAQGGEDE